MTTPADLDDALRARARAWRDEDPDPRTRAEVDALLAADDLVGLRERFDHRLQFGTAGLRGALGAGPNRMNRALVRRATAGVAAWLHQQGLVGPVVVGRDARHGSAEFAEDTAAVLAGAGFPVHVLPRPLPTPVTAFATLHEGAIAGIMITASHNPPQDNGYKLYLGDGAQIVGPVDAEISACIDAVGALTTVPLSDDGSGRARRRRARRLRRGGGRPGAGKVRATSSPSTPPCTASGPRPCVVSSRRRASPRRTRSRRRSSPTPTSRPSPSRTLRSPAPSTCRSPWPPRSAPTSCWPTTPTPIGSRWPYPTRPPPAAGGPSPATSSARCWPTTSSARAGTMPTTCSRPRSCPRACCRSWPRPRGVAYGEALTGFKWVVRTPLPGQRFVFGYEEALGYCVGTLVRDKDGVSPRRWWPPSWPPALKADGADAPRTASTRSSAPTAPTSPASGRSG